MPIAVLISDIHYSLPTLSLADVALRQAVKHANTLNVPVIVAGDLHDTKANLRGECISAMIKTFKTAKLKPIVLIGNHDLINEKGQAHSLEFLHGYVELVDVPRPILNGRLYGIPYCTEMDKAKECLRSGFVNSKTSPFIMHQGFKSSFAGEYVQDKSALNAADCQHLHIISGHYHTRQHLCTSGHESTDSCSTACGQWNYIGNPYTVNFAEANDPPKGFQVLMDNGSLQFVPTNLRKHVVLDLTTEDLDAAIQLSDIYRPGDLLRVRLTGNREELTKISRKDVADFLGINSFKLETIALDNLSVLSNSTAATQPELLDAIIEQTSNVSDAQKGRLKKLWRALGENN